MRKLWYTFNMRKLLITLILSFSFLINPLFTFAQDDVKPEVNVTHIANILEKFQEKVTLFFKFSPNAKYDYNKYLLEKRLGELEYVINSDNWDPIEETSSRYSTNLGNFNDYVINNKLTDKKDEVLNIYTRHKKILERLQKKFDFETGFWLLLQHDINSTDIFTKKIQESL